MSGIFEVTLWTPVIHTVLEQLNFTTFVESSAISLAPANYKITNWHDQVKNVLKRIIRIFRQKMKTFYFFVLRCEIEMN